MNQKTFMLSLLTVVTAIAIAACTNSSTEKKSSPEAIQTERIKRGEYLVNSIGCDDCHSPKIMGPNGFEIIPETRLSGYPSSRPIEHADTNVVKNRWMMLGADLTSAVGPWGMSFAANLTSDATGIGNWTEENFMRAIREGKYKGLPNSRPLLPPMPWFVYKNLTDEDLKSIFAYLKSTKPVKNQVPAPIPFSAIK